MAGSRGNAETVSAMEEPAYSVLPSGLTARLSASIAPSLTVVQPGCETADWQPVSVRAPVAGSRVKMAIVQSVKPAT